MALDKSKFDPLLITYLTARPDREAHRLDSLVKTVVDEAIRRGVHKVIRVAVPRDGTAGATQDEEDALDVYSDTLAVVIEQLKALRAAPDNNAPITNINAYAATVARNMFQVVLRKRDPKRARLIARLTYLLKGDFGFAEWALPDGGRCCGFQAWASQSRPHLSARLSILLSRPTAVRHSVLGGLEPGDNNHADVLRAVFNWLGHPLRFADLDAICRGLWRLTRPVEVTSVPGPDGQEVSPLDALKAPDDVQLRVVLRDYLGDLWGEMRRLPVKQLKALLFNLREGKGGKPIIYILPSVGIGPSKIAAAMEMSLDELRDLWPDLPIDDERIAQMMGLTRQQVIGLRSNARERLARHMPNWPMSE